MTNSADRARAGSGDRSGSSTCIWRLFHSMVSHQTGTTRIISSSQYKRAALRETCRMRRAPRAFGINPSYSLPLPKELSAAYKLYLHLIIIWLYMEVRLELRGLPYRNYYFYIICQQAVASAGRPLPETAEIRQNSSAARHRTTPWPVPGAPRPLRRRLRLPKPLWRKGP